jgi:hypothetical protein
MKTYELIIEQAKNQIRERNHHFNVDEAFGKCEVEAISVLSELFGTFSYWSKVYCEEDNELNALKEYKVHETIINFYKSYEPKELDYLGDGVRLADLRGIKNSINNGEPRIIYADQTWFSFNDSERKLEIRFNHEDIPDNIVWFDKEVIRFLPEISKTFNDFLDKLSMNPDWDLEEYYNLIGNNL